MSQAKKIRYEVRISARQSCAPDKTKYNQDFEPSQTVEANNYFNTLAERYLCYNHSRQDETTKQALGELYIITLTTILENNESCG